MQPELNDTCNWEPVNTLMLEGVQKGVFPGAVLLVWLKGSILLHRGYGNADIGHTTVAATPEILYDLASLTKPLVTTLAVIGLVEKKKLSIDSGLDEIFQNEELIPSDKKKITVRHLLSHTSGLPAYKPYYRKLTDYEEKDRWKRLWGFLLDEPLGANPGASTCYSDLGFLVLQKVVEFLSKKSLWKFVREQFYLPLGLTSLVFSPAQVNQKLLLEFDVAATEICHWRGRKICGEVHDENAFVLGGIAGHAGLFGTAEDICKLLTLMFFDYSKGTTHLGVKQDLLRTFWERQTELGNGTWALGFDTPAATASSAGKYFSPNSVGHLGFTGTSFWFDLDRELLVVLLSNRVYIGRENEKIKEFRPLIHDRIIECLDSV